MQQIKAITLFKSTRWISVLLAFWLTWLSGATADQHPPVLARIAPAPEHLDLDRTITNLLSVYHYRRSKPDDSQSGAILDAYLEALDFNRSHFLASDIRQFERYRNRLDDYLLSGHLEPAYEIFNVYLQRLAERTDLIERQLVKPVDFSIKESLQLDRDEQPWARSVAELDEIWRKRLKHELLLLVLAGKEIDDARDTLLKRYQGRLRRTTQYKSQDVFQIYMNAVAASFDPHTAYFSPRATENFNIQMRLSLEGIGTVLRMEEEQITVVELVPGGPADLSDSMHPNDKIIGVGQGDEGPMVDVIGWRLDDVVDLIRGKRGTVVRLNLLPAVTGPSGNIQEVRLVRDTIKLEKQAANSEMKTLPDDKGQQLRIGVITIPTFYSDFAAAQRGDRNYRSTTRDVRRLLQEFQSQNIDGIVIDLRQNGGGSLQEAVELTGLFIPEGPVVQVRNANGDIDIEVDPDPAMVYDGPLAVLVNQFSASASEIFAAAMQDYGRAIILGNPTFGKGTVQTLVNLNRFVPNAGTPLGQLKLTIAKFYRISGSSTQHRGVIPDIQFPSPFNAGDVGESAQDFALPWDEISPVRYRRGDIDLAAIMPKLIRNHQYRVDTNLDLKQLLSDIEDAKQARARTTISLTEQDRRNERDRLETKRRQRENERRVTLGLAPLADDETIGSDSEQADPLLDESVKILSDMIGLLTRSSSAVVLRTQ